MTESNPVKRLCIHCGEEIPALFLNCSDAQFCCSGCETVYQFLTTHGLSHFYELKSSLPSFSKTSPITFTENSFNYLDQLEFTPTIRFYLEGIHCVACLWLVEKIPSILPGVYSASLVLGKNTATFIIDPALKRSELAQLLQNLGYRPHLIESDNDQEIFRIKEDRKLLIQLGLAAAIAGNIMIFSVSLYTGASGSLGEFFRWTCFVMGLPVVFYCSIPFYKSSWASIRMKSISMDVPVSVAIIVGTVMSTWNLITGREHIYFDSIAMLVFLLLSTRYLLRRVTHFALDSSHLVHYLLPKYCTKWDRVTRLETEVLSESILPGDIIRVHPGQPIPVDGTVVEGKSWINMSAMTGESHPQPVEVESFVFSGTINGEGILDICTLETGPQTRLGKLLTDIQTRPKPTLVTLADRFSQYLLWGVAIISLVLIVVFAWIGNLSEGINRALALLVVTCPCALAIATPLSFSIAMKQAASKGILIKDSDVIEKINQLDTIIFDKTGTLTFGNIEVLEWSEVKHSNLSVFYALECCSSHPVALAIRRYLAPFKDSSITIQNPVETIGYGVSGTYNGELYELCKGMEWVEAKINGEVVATLMLGDQLRTDAKQVLLSLKEARFNLILASGDTVNSVHSIAKQLCFEPHEIYSSVSPEFKQSLVEKHPFSLMVGDGANDAAALSRAHIGVAVQGSLEVSLRAADVYMIAPGVRPIESFISIGKITMRIVKINLALSMIYNVIFSALAILGYVTPLAAAIFMPLSSLIVVLVSLSAYRSKF